MYSTFLKQHFLLLLAAILHQSNASDVAEKICEETHCPFPSWVFGGGCYCTRERTYTVHLPPSTSGSNGPKLPLVLNLHALGSDALFQKDYSGFNEIADKEGIVVAYPQGITSALVGTSFPVDGPLFSWNAGGCCAPAIDPKFPTPVDDIAHLRKVLDEIKTKYDIDSERVYVTGMSNGGFMTNRVACEMRDLIAAVAPVAGPLMENAGNRLVFEADPFVCSPGKPVPILHFHHIKDPIVTFDGNPLLGFPSIPQSIERWREVNQISSSMQDERPDENTVCEHYARNTSSSVSLCKIDGTEGSNAHCWPGKGSDFLGSLRCQNTIGNEYIWDFFKKYTLSGYVHHPFPAIRCNVFK